MILAAGSIVAFTNMNTNPDDKNGSCHLTIVYEENGESVVLDTTFACEGAMDVESFIDGLNLPKGTKITCEMECEKTADGSNRMGGGEFMLKHGGDGGIDKTVEIIKVLDDDGNETVKIMVNGQELDLEDGAEFELEGMDGSWTEKGEGMKIMVIETEEEDADDKTVIVKCTVGGEGCKMKCCEGKKGSSSCQKRMKFSGEEGEEQIFIQVIEGDGDSKRCIVIIKTLSDDDQTILMREAPEAVPNMEKSALGVSNLKFSPNPNDGHFNLSFELPETTPAKIAVYSMEGRKVYSKKIRQPEGTFSEDIDISKSGSGTYFLQITQGDKAQTKKIVIQ